MLSVGLWRWYINIIITILDIICRPVFYLNYVSETGFCFRLLGDPKRGSLAPPPPRNQETPETNFFDLSTSWTWVVSFTPLPLYPPGKVLPVPIGDEDVWAPKPVWKIWRSENSWPYRDSNVDPLAAQFVASRYTDCATAAVNEFQSFQYSNANSELPRMQMHAATAWVPCGLYLSSLR
jgi:hypothetical protein